MHIKNLIRENKVDEILPTYELTHKIMKYCLKTKFRNKSKEISNNTGVKNLVYSVIRSICTIQKFQGKFSIM